MTLNLIGFGGVSLLLMAYALLQFDRLHYRDLRYLLLNLVGSIGILISLLHSFDLASFVIEVTWAAISLFGILKALRNESASS